MPGQTSLFDALEISTHALREEGDLQGPARRVQRAPISTHALREEGDVDSCVTMGDLNGFLPTPSARRATARAGSDRKEETISTHALREEGDFELHKNVGGLNRFLPTPSARRATHVCYCRVFRAL